MKPIRLKDNAEEKYQLIETAEDLSARRYATLKEFLIQKETGVVVPMLVDTLRGFIQNYDKESKAGMLITLHNYLSGINQVAIQEDADQMIFTLLVLEKDEDPTRYDKTQAKAKLERMNSEGLTQGFITKVVEDFLKGSPILLQYYLTMGLLSRQKNLTSSENLD